MWLNPFRQPGAGPHQGKLAPLHRVGRGRGGAGGGAARRSAGDGLRGPPVEKDGIPVELTAKEYSILELLLRNPRRVLPKAQLYAAVWGEAYLGDENAVNVHISRLRSKVEDDPKKPRCICTVWGIGYKLGDGDGR